MEMERAVRWKRNVIYVRLDKRSSSGGPYYAKSDLAIRQLRGNSALLCHCKLQPFHPPKSLGYPHAQLWNRLNIPMSDAENRT